MGALWRNACRMFSLVLCLCTLMALVGCDGSGSMISKESAKNPAYVRVLTLNVAYYDGEYYLKEIPEGTCLHIGDSWECDIIPSGKLGIDSFRLKMSTEIYEFVENTIPPQDLQARTRAAEYVAKHYNSPFS